jgi:NAD(P)-dependent dehydrogenase (short-subunit alcohol dehydrogenase family)
MPLAVVVGAGAMGMAIARRLGQRHRLILAEVDGQRLEAAAATLKSEGIWVVPVVCDVTQATSVNVLAQVVSNHGPMRTLAHVAGLSPSMADWRTIMLVNLVGPTLMADALLPLVTQGSAAIFVASLAAHLAVPEPRVMQVLDEPLKQGFLAALVETLGQEPSTQQSYQLSKTALVRLCQRRAIAWGERHARIVSLSPGLIATPMGALEFRNPFKYELLAKTPLQRQGGMPEIADAVEFLASDRASFISGIDLLVDGGLNAASHFPA